MVDGVETIVICQEGSFEYKMACEFACKIITTKDIPTIGAAWNLGIKKATGKYLVTANTDDTFLPGSLKRMASVLDHTLADLLFSDVYMKNENQFYLWKRFNHSGGFVFNMNEILKTKCIIGAMPMWRRSVHTHVGQFDENMTVACDFAMWAKMATYGYKFYYLPEALGTYANRHDSLEHRNAAKLREENEVIKCALE